MKIQNESSPSKRLAYVDIAKAIAIVLVLMGHTVDTDTMAKTVIYSFHMPLFFILSGMVLRDQPESIAVFIEKKFRTLYFPYFLWACIYANLTIKNLAFIVWGTRETLIKADSLSSLWFLPVMLIASVLIELLQCIIVKLDLNRIVSYCLSTGIFFTIGFLLPHHSEYGDPLGADIAFVAAGFMLTGKLLSKLYTCQFSEKPVFHGVCLIVSLIVMLLYFVYDTSEDYVLMANAVYGNPVCFLLIAWTGSILVLSFSRLTEQLLSKPKLIALIGRNTLSIFILHKPFIQLFRKCIEKVGFDYNHPICMLGIPVITLCIIMPMIILTNQHIPFVWGIRKGVHHEQNSTA